MKRIIVSIVIASMVLVMQSCYQSSTVVGSMTVDEPSVCVHTFHKAHFLGGLITSDKNLKVKDYVKNREAYKVKNYHSFLDGLLSSVTLGIYTPTTIKIYLPMRKK